MESGREGGFVILTSAGDVHAESLVLSTGAYQRPYRPRGADRCRPICFRSTSTTSGTPRRCMSFDAGAFASSQVKPGENRSCRELRGGARRLAPGSAGCTTFRNGAARRGASHTWQATRWPSNCCPLSRGSSEPARTRLICLISSLGVWLNELSGDVTRRSTCMRVT